MYNDHYSCDVDGTSDLVHGHVNKLGRHRIHRILFIAHWRKILCRIIQDSLFLAEIHLSGILVWAQELRKDRERVAV